MTASEVSRRRRWRRLFLAGSAIPIFYLPDDGQTGDWEALLPISRQLAELTCRGTYT
jgi:hypothetical protein